MRHIWIVCLSLASAPACGDVVVGSFEGGTETGAVESMSMALMVGEDRLRSLSLDSGSTWPLEQLDLPDDNTVLHAVAYADGRFVAVGGGWTSRIETSVDGENWELVYDEGGGGLRDLVHTGTRWVAVGKGGEIMISEDGLNWSTQVVELDGDALWAVASDGADMLLAVGNGDVVASYDGGLSWLHKFNDGKDHVGVAFDDAFVVVDEDGEVHIASENAAVWQSSAQSPAAFQDIIAADGALWAPGVERLWTSPNGLSWTSTPMPSTASRIAWSDGVFLGAGGGQRLRSTDGVQWEVTHSDPPTLALAVTFGPSLP